MLAIALVVLVLAVCAADPEGRAREPGAEPIQQVGGGAVTIAAAGDIGAEGGPSDANVQTAALIEDLTPDAVLTLGDNQYEDGELDEFLDSYDLTWGRLKDITYPTPGNHEYGSGDAEGYFDYFGDAANPPDGYYSFDLGNWHLVAVNSNDFSEEQLAWIRNDLRSDGHPCELAYWHEPRWSSGDRHGSDSDMARFWRIMVHEGVDVVLNAHDHVYERFAKMNAAGAEDLAGVREFVVGTGGASLYGFDDPETGSKVRIAQYGVLTMVLEDLGYSWEFLKADDGMVLDEGSTRCHA